MRVARNMPARKLCHHESDCAAIDREMLIYLLACDGVCREAIRGEQFSVLLIARKECILLAMIGIVHQDIHRAKRRFCAVKEHSDGLRVR